MVRAYEYDGLDRMISKWSYDEDAFSLSEWRHYYYSDQWQFLEERVADSYTGSYSGSGIPAMSGWGLSGSGIAGTFRLDRQFVWGLRYVNDLVLRDRDTDTNGSLDERIYALQDPNWNVVAIANTSGTILKRFCYSAYGAPKYFTSNFSDSTAGYDWETLYCGYRYDYHTDSDVKWHIAGHRILLSHLGRWNRRDPIGYKGGINPYEYVGDSPLMRTDPTGLAWGTPSFFWHYYFGGGATVNLADIGLLDTFKQAAAADIKRNMDANLQNGLTPDCDNPSQTRKGSFTLTNVSVGSGGYFDPMTVIGNTTVSADYQCTTETTCKCCPGEKEKRPVRFTGNCTVTFHLRDRFANPTDKNGQFYERDEKAYQACMENCADTFHWLWDRPYYKKCVDACERRYPPSEWVGATPYNIIADWSDNYSWNKDLGGCP